MSELTHKSSCGVYDPSGECTCGLKERERNAATKQLRAENAALRAEIAQTEFRNERLVSDYASIQEELSTIRRIHVQNIAIKDAEIARWKTVPMKYRRMEFNAQLQEENASLKEQVVTLEKLQGIALIETLRAEVERLKAHQCTPVCVFHEREELRKLCEQLAASQLEAKRIREQRDLAVSALQFYMDHGICEVTYYNVRDALAAIKESEG